MRKSNYHEGELAVQERAGVRQFASRLEGGIRSFIPEAAREFLTEQPMAIIGASDPQGRLWASILTGKPGFLHSKDNQSLHIAAKPVAGDPLAEPLKTATPVGLLVIELATRRRMRLNGESHPADDGGISISTAEVFSNCPKYIQARDWGFEKVEDKLPPAISRSKVLSDEQRQWISRADTFFIASSNPAVGVDVSHRGGSPGFIHLTDEKLLWGDYQGNNMFQTLGNLALNSNAGLLFIDFEQGRTLHLSGKAEIIWDETLAVSYGGEQRVVAFKVEQVVEISGALSLRWKLVEYSPFNPD